MVAPATEGSFQIVSIGNYEEFQIERLEKKISELTSEIFKLQELKNGQDQEIVEKNREIEVLQGELQATRTMQIRLIEIQERANQMIIDSQGRANAFLEEKNELQNQLERANEVNLQLAEEKEEIEQVVEALARSNETLVNVSMSNADKVVEMKRAFDSITEAAQTSINETRNAIEETQRMRNTLIGAGVGGSVGGGTAVLVNAFITTINPPLAIAIMGAGAIGGAIIGNKKKI